MNILRTVFFAAGGILAVAGPIGPASTAATAAVPRTNGTVIASCARMAAPMPAAGAARRDAATIASGRRSRAQPTQTRPITLPPGHCPPQRIAVHGHGTVTLPPLPALLILVLASAMAPVLRRQLRPGRRGSALALLRKEIDREASGLRIKRMQMLAPGRTDPARAARWNRAKRRFGESRLRPLLVRHGLGRFWPELEGAALRRIEQAARRGRKGPAGFDPAMHPLDYERFCARQLERAGWRTRLTPASGDQGADILAERGGVRLVVQCKLYRSAVGNDAVQQVAAARAHQNAQAAIVVSNARFTTQARALARSNRVALLHHEELAGYRPDRAPSSTIDSATW